MTTFDRRSLLTSMLAAPAVAALPAATAHAEPAAEHWPVDSIRDISLGGGDSSPASSAADPGAPS